MPHLRRGWRHDPLRLPALRSRLVAGYTPAPAYLYSAPISAPTLPDVTFLFTAPAAR